MFEKLMKTIIDKLKADNVDYTIKSVNTDIDECKGLIIDVVRVGVESLTMDHDTIQKTFTVKFMFREKDFKYEDYLDVFFDEFTKNQLSVISVDVDYFMLGSETMYAQVFTVK